jgi:hypothetical protein
MLLDFCVAFDSYSAATLGGRVSGIRKLLRMILTISEISENRRLETGINALGMPRYNKG